MKTSYRILCALLSGVLLCFSFPTILFGWYAPDLGFLAWIALVPLIIAMRDARPSRAFLFTFFTGLVAYSGSLYWLYQAMHNYGKLSPALALLTLVLLVIILSIYLALASLATTYR
jgi:apolipoprotein N-acyltransferase